MLKVTVLPHADLAVAERCRARMPGAFEEVYRTHAPRLFGLICRLVGRMEAEDLLQETFLSAHRKLGSYKGEAALGRDGEQIALYFQHPKDGLVSARCPDYVALESDQRKTFFIRLRKIDQEWRAFLEMGSDVREPAAKAPGA